MLKNLKKKKSAVSMITLMLFILICLRLVFRRAEEKYFPRKTKAESSQFNDEKSMQQQLPAYKTCEA